MNAKWLIKNLERGIVNLTYHNLKDEVVLDCGSTNKATCVGDFIDFALAEGAEAGDGIYLDGVLICEVILNKELIKNDIGPLSN